jgi:glutathione S-transferase
MAGRFPLGVLVVVGEDAGVTMVVYGAGISYFTGKFEAYLRYKQIPYDYRGLHSWHYRWTVPRALGATQYPSVRLGDGRWMSDTTPMIAWLEQENPEPAVIPRDPVQRFVSLLVEDYADEWLWRPAMHYRWSYAEDRERASDHLAREIVTLPLPRQLRASWVADRQTKLFVAGDGIDEGTRAHAEGSYLRLLEMLEPIFSARPFMLGGRPTLADFGLMGPCWRHFAEDPTPARLMQERAPAVRAWVTRMLEARAEALGAEPLSAGVPADWSPLLRVIGETHLEALAANALAHQAGEGSHDLTVQGVTYRDVPTSAYRVWCLEQLRARFEELPDDAAAAAREILEAHRCWEPLWRVEAIDSGHDRAGEAPFCQALRMVRD